MIAFRYDSPAIRLMAFAVVLHVAACTGPSGIRFGERVSREEAVHFANGNVILAGTLVIPDGLRQHPAVVLFHGSGPQQRDLFTARWFAKQGVAALVYDKRGVGESTGNFRNVPFMELSGDGLAAIDYLKSRKDIDPKRIGVWGISQGGWLGPLAASRSPDVAFVIAVSGPAVSPGEQMIFYYANELRAKGVPEKDIQAASTLRRNVWNYLSTGNRYDDAKNQLNQARTKPWYNEVKMQGDDLFAPLPSPAEIGKPDYRYARWFKQEMNYDPVPALRALNVPALFLFGDDDCLVQVDESVAIIRRILNESGNRDFSIHVFHDVEHDMTDAATGQVDPKYLDTMRNWLAAHLR
jgi:pimeloyl-ACP methyl ester carboxylesterase